MFGMLILTHDTLRNPDILRVRQLPRKFFGRVTVWPKNVKAKTQLRLMAEWQLLRYFATLAPLIGIAMIWNGAALPLSQAPLLMILMIGWVEMRLLRVPKKKRAGLIDPVEADRGLDLLRLQGREALTQIAALRGQNSGTLHLVVEQSELGLLAPLTYVSVQSDEGPEVVDLSQAERAILHEQLFQGPLTERLLHRINQSQDTFLRDISFDARGVSAHARLAAALA